MPSQTTYLITGANRGIGNGLVQNYLSRPNTVVIATTRDLSSPSSKALSTLSAGKNSKIIVVKLDSSVDTDAETAINELKAVHGITHIDTVIANAGIANYWGPTSTTPIAAFQNHFNINTMGTLTLFQATNALLDNSSKPKFVYISTVVGSIGDAEKWPLQGVAYGASKAAANYIMRKIHLEHPKLTVFPLHPGWVQTEMGNDGAVANGLEQAPVTLKDSIDGLTEKVCVPLSVSDGIFANVIID
jgi:norsolorinic acid ketoreductase